MAYLRNIEAWCDSMSCAARAKVELVGTQNQSYGRFCIRCGKVKLKELIQKEADFESAGR